ncbi:MAG: energy transducer TonB [Saprospiraceae bacterium]|nr:energy transducer TonB [Saprospiraceae bacterium]
MKRIPSLFLFVVLFVQPALAQRDTANTVRPPGMAAEITQAPSFPGGEPGLLQFLSDHLQYPPKAREKGIEGVVTVSFVVQRNGRIAAGKIVEDIGEGCGAEVLRILDSMPAWKPGEVDGWPVNIRYTLPVRFALEAVEEEPQAQGLLRPRSGQPEIMSDQYLAKHQYVPLDEGMCFANFNPSGWNDNFLSEVSDPYYFGVAADARQRIPDQMPLFPDGFEGLQFYFYFHMKYPEEALRKKISGRAVMAIDIDAAGIVQHVEAIKTEHHSFGKAAEEAIYNLPPFFPAIQDGVFVPLRLYIPVKFSLN